MLKPAVKTLVNYELQKVKEENAKDNNTENQELQISLFQDFVLPALEEQLQKHIFLCNSNHFTYADIAIYHEL